MASLFDMRDIATVGRLEWIGIRPSHRGGIIEVESAELLAGRGIVGDHTAERVSGKRQVTLIQHEHLPLIARFAGVEAVEPAALRRNLVVSGVNLGVLKRRPFRVGEVILEGTGDCHPCARMDEAIGSGGFNAMRGCGGLTAIVHIGGCITVGDMVTGGIGNGISPK